MKITGTFQVPAPREAVYERLNDAHFFASCVEGVSDLQEQDPLHYTAKLETRIAYIKFSFNVAVEFINKVPPETIAVKADGTPIGIVGRLTSTAMAQLTPAGNATDIVYEIDVALTGRLGSIGQPVLKAKAKEMERSFVKNINAAFAAKSEGAP